MEMVSSRRHGSVGPPCARVQIRIVLLLSVGDVESAKITTAWRVLGLRKEETVPRYGGQLRIY
jgi:hypothetical protein